MALTQRGDYWYGESQADIPAELARFSTLNCYPATQFAAAVCTCGHKVFELATDEEEGVACRTCVKCGVQHILADGAEYTENALLNLHECDCENTEFEITAGVALYPESEDVRWLFIGCHCPQCHLVGCFAHWKLAAGPYQPILANT